MKQNEKINLFVFEFVEWFHGVEWNCGLPPPSKLSVLNCGVVGYIFWAQSTPIPLQWNIPFISLCVAKLINFIEELNWLMKRWNCWKESWGRKDITNNAVIWRVKLFNEGSNSHFIHQFHHSSIKQKENFNFLLICLIHFSNCWWNELSELKDIITVLDCTNRYCNDLGWSVVRCEKPIEHRYILFSFFDCIKLGVNIQVNTSSLSLNSLIQAELLTSS